MSKKSKKKQRIQKLEIRVQLRDRTVEYWIRRHNLLMGALLDISGDVEHVLQLAEKPMHGGQLDGIRRYLRELSSKVQQTYLEDETHPPTLPEKD